MTSQDTPPHDPLREVAPQETLRMSFGEHLEELRWRVLMALVGVVASAAVTLFFGKEILAWLCVPLIQAQRLAEVPTQAYAMSPLSGFAIYLKVSLVAALIIASPWVLYQGWRFIEAGLYKSERRILLLIAPFSGVMAFLGVAFMYHVMLPTCLWFLISFSTSYPPVPTDRPASMFMFSVLTDWSYPPRTPSEGDATDRPSTLSTEPTPIPVRIPILAIDPTQPVDGALWFKTPEHELRFYYQGLTRAVTLAAPSMLSPLIEINQYVNFVSAMALGSLIAFQLPVVMLIVGWVGLIDPAVLAAYRRHCVFACFVVGMILTPADVLSMLLMSIPLWGLFELGLLLMRIADRRRHLAL